MFRGLKEIFRPRGKSQPPPPPLFSHGQLHDELAAAFTNETRLRGEKPKEERVRSQATAAAHYWTE